MTREITSGNSAQFLLPSDIRIPSSSSDHFVPNLISEAFEGALNKSYVVVDESGNKYLWRIRKEQVELDHALFKEYEGVGFLANGGSYRYRTTEDQVQFMYYAASLGLKVVTPLYSSADGILLSFIPGLPFDSYLQEGHTEATFFALDNLLDAHRMGVVFGDRWVKNTMITENDAVEIDFDIEITGDSSKEFELSQTFYHILYFASDKDEVLTLLKIYCSERKDRLINYQLAVLIDLLEGHAKYFNTEEYDITNEKVRELVNALSALHF